MKVKNYICRVYSAFFCIHLKRWRLNFNAFISENLVWTFCWGLNFLNRKTRSYAANENVIFTLHDLPLSLQEPWDLICTTLASVLAMFLLGNCLLIVFNVGFVRYLYVTSALTFISLCGDVFKQFGSFHKIGLLL